MRTQEISKPLNVESAHAMPLLHKFWNKNRAFEAASPRDKYVHPSSGKIALVETARDCAGRRLTLLAQSDERRKNSDYIDNLLTEWQEAREQYCYQSSALMRPRSEAQNRKGRQATGRAPAPASS